MPEQRIQFVQRAVLLAIFAVAMGYLEAAVVVYLRELYYPDGFAFPLRLLPRSTLLVEVGREFATLVMLAGVAVIAGRRQWERFGWFLFLFGAWDVWYYIWLKLTVGWPPSLFDWDVLFLIPVPWISPVIAPLLIAVSMIIIGLRITRAAELKGIYRAGKPAWGLALLGSAFILYSFMRDTGAVLNQELPRPYSYWLLTLGLACFWGGFVLSLRHSKRHNAHEGKDLHTNTSSITSW